jgi:hypothetical protein
VWRQFQVLLESVQVDSRAVQLWIVQGVPGGVAEYDLLSGCKLAACDIAGLPVSLAYGKDGAKLAVILSDRAVFAFGRHLLGKRQLNQGVDRDGSSSALLTVSAASALAFKAVMKNALVDLLFHRLFQGRSVSFRRPTCP